MDRFSKVNKENGRGFLMVYLAGHGCTVNGQQSFIVNAEAGDKIKQCYAIESKLRILAKEYDAKVATFFDICRTEKPANMRGGGKESEDEEMTGDHYSYS